MNALAQSTKQNNIAPTSNISSLLVQRKCACGGVSKLGGQCSECESKKLVGGNGLLIQPKLKVGQPNDKYEQEADRVADEVMQMPVQTTLTPQGANSARPYPVFESDRPTSLQRSCAARSNKPALAVHLRNVHRSVYRAINNPGVGGTTNHAFDTYSIIETHLSDPDIIARLNALSIVGLVEYRNRSTDTGVRAYINNIIQNKPALNCTSAEVAKTTRFAEAARTSTLPWVQLARRALVQLHHVWSTGTNKQDILSGNRTLAGESVCAFNSNFNTHQRNKSYGQMHIQVMSRLRSLEREMSRAVAYSCQPITDPQCSGLENSDTIAYVRGGRPPIHFCKLFRDSDSLEQQGIVTHEFAHLLAGVTDVGGYALGGPAMMTCVSNLKFSAATNDLVTTADALAGFVLHIGHKKNIRSELK